VPPPRAGNGSASYKVSKRIEQDISAVCAAFAVQVEHGTSAHSARIAFGGMAGIPARARATENALIGTRLDSGQHRSRGCHALDDFNPLTDLRASRRIEGSAPVICCADSISSMAQRALRCAPPMPLRLRAHEHEER
jgi:xanthine dehydrogenase iron-sulfur cluster and FAD-binding subunit A